MVENNKPMKIYKSGVVSLSVWKNGKEGNEFISFSFKRAYKDKKEDKWKNSSSFFLKDLPKLKALIDEAYKENIVSERKFIE